MLQRSPAKAEHPAEKVHAERFQEARAGNTRSILTVVFI